MKYTWLLILALLTVSGCAFTEAKLDVSFNESMSKPGPLSSIHPIHIKVEPLRDNRQFLDKIGYVKNGFGMNCANVVTTNPVPEIIRNGIVMMLQKNGHTVTEENPNVIISGDVERFWYESQINFWTVEFMGTADLNLEIKDPSTNNVLLAKRFSGHHNEEMFGGGYHKEMQLAMNKALEDLITQVAMDSQFSQVLQSRK